MSAKSGGDAAVAVTVLLVAAAVTSLLYVRTGSADWFWWLIFGAAVAL